MEKVYLVSLGCPRAEVDSEKMLYALKSKGYEQVYAPEEANIILINTCAFIEPAREESVNTIEEMKYNYPNKKIIVSGCLVELLEENYPDAYLSFGVGLPAQLPKYIKEKNKIVKFENKWKDPEQGIKRIIQTSPHYAYLRIADGCNNKCSFCIIPQIRGKLISRPYEYIKEEAFYLIENGVKEIILVSEDTTAYGDDMGKTDNLINLLMKMEKDFPEDIMIRLMYMHPARVKEDLIKFMKDSPKIIPYLDIPVQHVNNTVLQNMNRPIKPHPIEVFEMIKNIYPDMTLRTTVMVGFPGEDNNAFNQLYKFLEGDLVDKFGVFVFSPEEGTSASKMEMPDIEISDERYNILSDLNASKYARYVNELESLDVIVEEIYPNEGFFLARGINDAPEVDFNYEVAYNEQPPQIGDIVKIRFTEE